MRLHFIGFLARGAMHQSGFRLLVNASLHLNVMAHYQKGDE
jgi:hypothetical protein